MAEPDDQIHVSATDARSGATPHMTRYILGISLVLIVVVFAFLFMK
jgi:hypothetical protein